MLMDYKGAVTVKIDGITFRGQRNYGRDLGALAPTALMMVQPADPAIGDSEEMQKAISMLCEVKESIINAYEIKTGLSRTRLSHLMDAETWLNANKAIELGFADGVLEDIKKQARPPDTGYAFSRRAVTNTLLNKVPVAPTEPAAVPQAGQATKPLYERLYLLRF